MAVENIIFQEEANIIGSILKDETLIKETGLQDRHFKDSRNKAIFQTMKALEAAGKNINTLSLMHLGRTKNINMGGNEHIKACIESVPSTAYSAFKGSEQAIKNYWTMEKAKNAAMEFINKQRERLVLSDLKELISEVNELEAETASDGGDFTSDLIERYKEHEAQPAQGMSGVDTGFLSLNKITDGWTAGNLIIIGARPSMGKTAFIINGILNGDENTHHNFYSLEMIKGEIIDRFIAANGKINLMKMKNPNKYFNEKERVRYNQAVGELDKKSISIRRDNTVQGIRASLRRNMQNHPNKQHVAYIDFLTLIKAEQQAASRHLEVERIIQDLKELAQAFQIPIIVLSQLNRSLEQRNDKRPIMADLRESGSIEQAADIILFLHREAYYNENADEKATDVIIAKNRQGITGKLNFEFYKETNLFRGIN